MDDMYRMKWIYAPLLLFTCASCAAGEENVDLSSYDAVIPNSEQSLSSVSLSTHDRAVVETSSGGFIEVEPSANVYEGWGTALNVDTQVDLYSFESNGRLDLLLKSSSDQPLSSYQGWNTSYNAVSYASLDLSRATSTRSSALSPDLVTHQQALPPLILFTVAMATAAFTVYEAVTSAVDFVVFHEEHVKYTDTGVEICATPQELVDATTNLLDVVGGVADKGLFLGMEIAERGGTKAQAVRAVLDISGTRGPVSGADQRRIMKEYFEKAFKKVFDKEARVAFYEKIFRWYAEDKWPGMTVPKFMLYNYSWLKRVYEEQHFRVSQGYLTMHLPIARLIFPSLRENEDLDQFAYFDIDFHSTCGNTPPISPLGAPCVMDDGYYADVASVETPADLSQIDSVTCIAGIIAIYTTTNTIENLSTSIEYASDQHSPPIPRTFCQKYSQDRRGICRDHLR